MSPLQSCLSCSGLKRRCTRSGTTGRLFLLSVAIANLRFVLALMPCCCMSLANLVFARTDASGQQFLVHAWPAVFALDMGMDGADVGQQGFVAVASDTPALVRFTAAQPVEVPARAHLQYPAGHTHRVQLSHWMNPGVPRCVSCAKYAPAFCDVAFLAKVGI